MFNPTTPRWEKITKTFSDFDDAGSELDIEIYDLPAKGIIHAIQTHVREAFAGGSMSTADVEIGIAGTLNKYLSSVPGIATANHSNTIADPEPESFSSSTSIRANLTLDTGALEDLTDGEIDFYLLISELPS